MTFDSQSAHHIAAAVHSGELSAMTVVDTVFARILDEDTSLRSFATLCRADARAAAARIDELDDDARRALPLAGVPVGVKAEIPGDDPLIARLQDAGAVIVGWTATPELCVWPTTDSGAHGVTVNPWDRDLSPGGSSGGSAAAVAAGLVPLAVGTDGMGSLRIPAASCGLVTIKPGMSMLPDTRPPAKTWGHLSEPGPMATGVGDLALLLSVMANRPELAAVAPLPADITVAVSTASPVRVGVDLTPVSGAWARAARQAASALAGLQVRTIEGDPPHPDNPLLLLARWTSAVARKAEAVNLPLSAMERRTRHHALLGRTVFRHGGADHGDTRWNRAVATLRAEVTSAMDEQNIDVWLTPTLADNPLEATSWHERSWGRNLWASMRMSPFCAQWNVLGWPAMSVPIGTTRSDAGREIPTGVQLVGKPGSEQLLLSIAAALESAQPWQRTVLG